MTTAPLPVFDADALRQAASRGGGRPPCERCAALACPGWETVPGGCDRTALQRIATLRQPGDDEPSTTEYHPGGTNSWSPEAPIAVGHAPYNRCDVWQCIGCGRVFLRYTEYEGYYVDERIRAVDPARVVHAG
ncbi:MAG TPA: hypothetical protein VLJ58_17820 [Ramlibacter sp.]|nr:hypothetical protein [Ramlibacter sp.]